MTGRAFWAGAAVAVGTGLLLVGANGALGLAGGEDEPVNRLVAAVLATALLGAVLARLRPRGLAWAMMAAAAVQAAWALVALWPGWGVEGPVDADDVLMLTAAFGGLWLLAAWLFRRAAAT